MRVESFLIIAGIAKKRFNIKKIKKKDLVFVNIDDLIAHFQKEFEKSLQKGNVTLEAEIYDKILKELKKLKKF